MKILTDFPRFPQKWTSGSHHGETSTRLVGATFKDTIRLWSEFRAADLILVHAGASTVSWLVIIFALVPFIRKPLVVVDLILRKPKTPKQRFLVWFKKQIFRRVDHFVNYFRDTSRYNAIYGIDSDRCSYIPFKSNLFGDPRLATSLARQKEDYVYAAGWSLRDYDTFFAAVEAVGYPAAMPEPDFARLREHGSRLTWPKEKRPKNLRFLPDSGDRDAWLRNLSGARVVVVPIIRDSLCSSGVSVYLDSMLLKKCVIISHGPGVSDVLTDQAILVPPEDPGALAEAIRRVWEDASERQAVAERGQRYAQSLGGEPELMRRVLESALKWYLKTQ